MDLTSTRLVGVINTTPDSFSDGGRFVREGAADVHIDAAVAHGLAMARAGAAVLDVGGESTRPGAARVDEAEQARRVVPVVRALRKALDDVGLSGVWVSVDTTRAAVADAAAQAGAGLLNDVSAGRESGDELLAVAAARGAAVCVMHMQGEPGTMQDAPTYADVVGEVHGFLAERARAAQAAGVPGNRVVVDPGIGFGKTLAHNLALMRALPQLVAAGRPVLLGASRKRWIGAIDPAATTPAARDPGTIASTLHAAAAGVQLVRVHEVPGNAQALRVDAALRTACDLTAEKSEKIANTNQTRETS